MGYTRGGGYIWEEKHFNLQSAKLFFLSFFQYEARISAFFTSRKIWNMFKVNDKVKNKDTVNVVLATLLLTLSTCFIPVGINLGKVSTSKMHENTWGRVNLIFHRLDKFDGPIFGGGRGRIYGGLIFGMLIGLHILGGVYSRGLIYGGVLTGFYGIPKWSAFAARLLKCVWSFWNVMN